ncbi:MAG TPA: hypothetical protein EYQ20_07260 [candidate division Zixibacteria bacterium]|nr:hypothetical protein [candidate division Zixibacteria bacterium]
MGRTHAPHGSVRSESRHGEQERDPGAQDRRGARCGEEGKETTSIVYISGPTAIRGQSGCLYVLAPPGVIERRSIEDGLELSL